MSYIKAQNEVCGGNREGGILDVWVAWKNRRVLSHTAVPCCMLDALFAICYPMVWHNLCLEFHALPPCDNGHDGQRKYKALALNSRLVSDSAPPSMIRLIALPQMLSLSISHSGKLLCKAPGTLEDMVCRLTFSSLWVVFCDWQFNFEPKWAISGSCWDTILKAKWLWLASKWILRIQLDTAADTSRQTLKLLWDSKSPLRYRACVKTYCFYPAMRRRLAPWRWAWKAGSKLCHGYCMLMGKRKWGNIWEQFGLWAVIPNSRSPSQRLSPVVLWVRPKGCPGVSRFQIICPHPHYPSPQICRISLKKDCNSYNTAGYPCYLCTSLNLPLFLACVYPVATGFLHLHVNQVENYSFLSLLNLIFWLFFV